MLNYFYRVARPFVLLQEIELALRGLIETCVSESQLRECVERALRKKYEGRGEPPWQLRDMTFDEYRNIVSAKGNWEFFEGVLGRNRELVASKLEQVRKIRNDIFHFRDSVSVVDHQTLAAARNWLFDKALALRARDRTEPSI